MIKEDMVRLVSLGTRTRPQCNLGAVNIRCYQTQVFCPGLLVPGLNLPKSLQQANSGVRRLDERTLLPKTCARAAIEGQKPPAGTQGRIRGQPPFGPEGLGVGAVDGGQTVHRINRVEYNAAFRQQNRRLPVGATALGKNGVPAGVAGIVGYGRLEAKC